MARIARITAGILAIVAGIFMLVLPGPGILSILGGLALLSRDVAWAGRLADRVKDKFGSSTDPV
jgi:drug/metabolite transporter (DMT)-like permease